MQKIQLLSNRLLVCIELELHAETGDKTVTVPMQGTHYHCKPSVLQAFSRVNVRLLFRFGSFSSGLCHSYNEGTQYLVKDARWKWW